MASSFLSTLLLFMTISLQHLSPCYSTTKPILLPLTHSLSRTKTTNTHHLLKSSTIKTATKFHHHRQHQISLPLSSGSDYILSLTLGHHPPQTINLYMDTGSDLVWFPSAPFECILCEGKPDTTPTTSLPHISPASSVSCSSPACSAAHSNLPSSDLCAIAGCPLETIETSTCSSFRCPPFYYAYGDGSLIARLHSDRLTIPTSAPLFQLPNFTFGCAHTALAEPIGVAGFGRGLLSLPAQLSALNPTLGNRFSYCLVSHSFNTRRLRHPSPLILGRSESEPNESEFVYTPMLHNPNHPYFYCVGLEAVSVAGKKLAATKNLRLVNKKGDGGMVVDSGTTFTMIPAELHARVVAELDNGFSGVLLRATATEEETGLRPCYYYEKKVEVPKVALHFGGNVSVVLPQRNYFFGFSRNEGGQKRKVGCFLMMSAGEESDSGGPAGILGNYQQQGFEVVYDLERGRVGFARRRCASLWDSIAQSQG